MPTLQPQYLRTIRFLIKAGGGEFSIATPGDFLICKEADGIFDLFVDENVVLQDFMLGLDYRPPASQIFSNLRLVNHSANDVSGVLIVGYGNIGDHRTNVIAARGSLSIVDLAPNKIRATKWDSLAANQWVSVLADATRDSLCIVAGASLLWRINGVTDPAPWDGITRPGSADWLQTSDTLDFCVTATARVVLYERLRVTSAPATPQTSAPDSGDPAPAPTLKFLPKSDYVSGEKYYALSYTCPGAPASYYIELNICGGENLTSPTTDTWWPMGSGDENVGGGQTVFARGRAPGYTPSQIVRISLVWQPPGPPHNSDL